MATKILEAQKRLFKNIFVCRNCKTKKRVDHLKILQGKVRCRKCGKNEFRPIKKK